MNNCKIIKKEYKKKDYYIEYIEDKKKEKGREREKILII